MKTAFAILVCALAGFLSACAHVQTVRIRVIDETDKKPVAGAHVATGYVPAAYSLASCSQSGSITNKDGTVELQANYLTRQPTLYGYRNKQLAPFFCVESADYLYVECWPALDDLERDITITVTPRGTEPRNADDMWVQPGFLARIGDDMISSWRKITSVFQKPEECGQAKPSDTAVTNMAADHDAPASNPL